MARADGSVAARILERRKGGLEREELDEDEDEGEDGETDEGEDDGPDDLSHARAALQPEAVEPPRATRMIEGIRVAADVEFFRARKLSPDETTWEKLTHGQDESGALYGEWPIEDLNVAEIRRRWGEGTYRFVFTKRSEPGGVKLRGNSTPLVVGPVPVAGDPPPRSGGVAPRVVPVPPAPPPMAPPVPLGAFPVTARRCHACGCDYPHTARFCGNCGAAGGMLGAPAAVATLDVVPGAPPDVAAVLTAYQQGQQNMLAVISMVTSTVTAQEAARTERYRIDSDARQREQALLFKEIRSVDRERAEHPPAVDADALARRISDDVREQLEDFEEEIDEKIAGAKPPPANATQETIASIGSALQAGLPVIEGVMSMVANRNGGGSPGGSSGNQPKTGE